MGCDCCWERVEDTDAVRVRKFSERVEGCAGDGDNPGAEGTAEGSTTLAMVDTFDLILVMGVGELIVPRSIPAEGVGRGEDVTDSVPDLFGFKKLGLGCRVEKETAWCKIPNRELLGSSRGVMDDETAVDAAFRELVLWGVTGADAVVGESRALLLPYEGFLGVCVGEVSPFRRRGVKLVGLRERGVGVLLAEMISLTCEDLIEQ